MEDNYFLEDHIVHVDSPAVRPQVLVGVVDIPEREAGSNQMREVGRTKDILGLGNMHNLDLVEVVRNHAEVDRNSLEVVAV